MITYTSQNMRYGKTVLNIILFVTLILLVFIIFTTQNEEAGDFVRGYIKLEDINVQKRYVETKLGNYSSEPEWAPATENNTSNQPEIIGKAGILVEVNSGDILYSKDSYKKRPIASLTKIMTAVIALEHKDINEKIYVTRDSANIGENSMSLSYGEVYTLEELLYGLVLHSGNDAAYAISEGVAGNTEIFVEWMNIKAKELGLNDTHFEDPSGLDDNTYSTPLDLVKLTRYALKNPNFKKIVGTLEFEIQNDGDNKYIYLYNQTNLLSSYPGVAGVKTGFTEKAGLCLVTYANNEGKEVVGVVLDSIDRKGDMILMLDHGFETLGTMIEHNLL